MSGAPKWVTWPFDFSTPKVKTPAPVVPAPPPTSSDTGTEEEAMSSVVKKSGYSKTILTGALTPTSTKKKQLGY